MSGYDAGLSNDVESIASQLKRGAAGEGGGDRMAELDGREGGDTVACDSTNHTHTNLR